MIFAAKNNYVFFQASACGLFMLRYTSGELIPILE
jgi:hypothetical protein